MGILPQKLQCGKVFCKNFYDSAISSKNLKCSMLHFCNILRSCNLHRKSFQKSFNRIVIIIWYAYCKSCQLKSLNTRKKILCVSCEFCVKITSSQWPISSHEISFPYRSLCLQIGRLGLERRV